MARIYSLITYRIINYLRKNWLFQPLILGMAVVFILSSGCSQYRVNTPIERYDPSTGYRGKFMGRPGNSENLLLYLTFSGGGTRAAALSYGVLEVLKKTGITIDGERRNLLDEIDAISAVSGGSFTAGYYGLFRDRIFEDFESKFLKKIFREPFSKECPLILSIG